MVPAIDIILLFILCAIGSSVLTAFAIATVTRRKLPWLVEEETPTRRYTNELALDRMKEIKEIKDDFDRAPLLQGKRDGETVWRPIPTVSSHFLTKQHIAVRIECSNTVEAGSSVGVRVDLSNNHPSVPLKDDALLILKMPTGALRFFGPNALDLRPNGYTISLFYIIEMLTVKGNYLLEFRLLSLGLEASKVLVVS